MTPLDRNSSVIALTIPQQIFTVHITANERIDGLLFSQRLYITHEQ